MAGKGRKPENGVDWKQYYASSYWKKKAKKEEHSPCDTCHKELFCTKSKLGDKHEH